MEIKNKNRALKYFYTLQMGRLISKRNIFEANKKAMFFTLTVIIIITLFLTSFSLYDEVEERESIQKRVGTMNSFINSVEKDLSRKLYITTYRSVFLAESKIINKKAYISDLNAFFREAFINGSVDGNATLSLIGYNLSAMIKDVQGDSNLIGASFNIDERGADIRITQDDPWNIKTTLIVNMTLVDESGLALINKTNMEITAYVPVTNFEDPYYFMSSSGTTTNYITRSIYEHQFLSSDYSNLTKHLNNSYYIANALAPNFLQRLKGEFSVDPKGNGIESLVNLQDLQSKGVIIDLHKPIVDYLYFNSTYTASGDYYSGLPPWFEIDASHKSTYNITASSSSPPSGY